jgi:hypothetical protein
MTLRAMFLMPFWSASSRSIGPSFSMTYCIDQHDERTEQKDSRIIRESAAAQHQSQNRCF